MAEEQNGELEDFQKDLLFRPADLNVIQADKKSPYSSPKEWTDLFDYDEYSDLYDKLVQNNFRQPSSIQGTSIELANKDKENPQSILAQAQNGSGKTLAFIVNSLLRVNKDNRNVQIIILVPNFELVIQTYKYFEQLAPDDIKYSKIVNRTGIDYHNLGQIVVSSPGNLFAIYKHIPSIDDLKVFVCDECDDVIANNSYHEDLLGFADKVKNAQFLLYSATLTDAVDKFINKYKPDILKILLPQTSVINKTNKHYIIDCTKRPKIDIIANIFEYLYKYQTFIFLETKRDVAAIQKELESRKLKCDKYTGELNKEEREEVITKFRKQEIKVLITTDILARGVDIPTAKIVINYDMPITVLDRQKIPNYENYLHRQGRVGRFGREGIIFNLAANASDRNFLDKIQKDYLTPSDIKMSSITPEKIVEIARMDSGK